MPNVQTINLELNEMLGCDPARTKPLEHNLRLSASAPILFNEDNSLNENLSESDRRVTMDLMARYQFHEPMGLLNISKSAHELYSAQEKAGSEPMYVTFEMPAGYSRFSSEEAVKRPNAKPSKEMRHRYWPKEVIWAFAEQTRQRTPVGYLGHEGFFGIGANLEMLNIPVKWETAIKATRKSDGEAVTLARGYAFDQGLNRTYFNTGVYYNASVNAVGSGEIDTTDKGTEKHPVMHIKSAELSSFDIVRRGQHGIPGTRMVANISKLERKMDPNETNGQNTNTGSTNGVSAERLLDRVQQQADVIAGYNVEIAALKKQNSLFEQLRNLFGATEDNVIERAEAAIAQTEKYRNGVIEFLCESIDKDKTRNFVIEHMQKSNAQSVADLKKAMTEAFGFIAEITGTDSTFNVNDLFNKGNGQTVAAESQAQFTATGYGNTDISAFTSENFVSAKSGGRA